MTGKQAVIPGPPFPSFRGRRFRHSGAAQRNPESPADNPGQGVARVSGFRISLRSSGMTGNRSARNDGK